MTPITDEDIQAAADAYTVAGSIRAAMPILGLSYGATQMRVRRAAERGLLGTEPVLPGYRIAKVTNTPRGDYVQQRPDLGEPYKPIDALALKGRTTWADIQPDGTRIATREVIMERASAEQQATALRAMVDALKEDLPRVTIMPAPKASRDDLLNQFVVTDNHFGMLSWREETGSDYDLRIAEQLLLDWFAAAVDQAPDAHTAVLAQLGDLMHHDALESVTPAHKHVLDADSRLQKVIRVVIRTIRRIIDMLLQKHQHVHVVMASGNHDPASSAWLREMLAVMYEDEPRISVDNSPSLYYAYEWGKTALFYHHGHKRGVTNVDATMAGMFRELYGRSKYAYVHVGHRHKRCRGCGGLEKTCARSGE